jgi:hypothetical protein
MRYWVIGVIGLWAGVYIERHHVLENFVRGMFGL